MALITRKTVMAGAVTAVVVAAAAGGFVWSGVYNVGADDAHTRPVYALMQTLRERSIEVRANQLQAPDLKDPARIRQGAGNYNAMCVGCHLAPGMAESEMSKGLYPAPPNLSKTAVDGAEAFWVIKHGIKASGMPAWGKSMGDEYIWNMAAFLQELPKLDAEKYQALVASSGGHSHGGGETMPHGHGASESSDHQDDGGEHSHGSAAEAAPHSHSDKPADHADASAAAGGEKIHRHADGKEHVHKAEAPTPSSTATKTETDTDQDTNHDQHEHQH